jgi:hypothetical protein
MTLTAGPTLLSTQNPVELPLLLRVTTIINGNNSSPCTDKSYIIFVSDQNAAFRGEFYWLTGWTSPAPRLHVPEGSMMVIWRPKHVEDDMEVSVLVIEQGHL